MIPTFTTTTGKIISVREPSWGDQELLLKYHESLQTEDPYVLVNNQEPVTLSEETQVLSYWLSAIHHHQELHYFLFDDSKLIGTCQVIRKGRRQHHVGDYGISLLPAYRHQGIGYHISRELFNEAKNLSLKIIVLDVFADNYPAIKLYQKLGFVEFGRLPRGLSYKDQYLDQLFMYKEL